MSLSRFNSGDFNSGTYLPSRFEISAISKAEKAIVTFTEDHNYVIGNEVQFIVPSDYGMIEMDEKKGFVLTVPNDDEIEMNIDTRSFSTFSVPVSSFNVAQAIAIGDHNYSSVAASNRSPLGIEGAYKNEFP